MAANDNEDILKAAAERAEQRDIVAGHKETPREPWEYTAMMFNELFGKPDLRTPTNPQTYDDINKPL